MVSGPILIEDYWICEYWNAVETLGFALTSNLTRSGETSGFSTTSSGCGNLELPSADLEDSIGANLCPSLDDAIVVKPQRVLEIQISCVKR